MPALPENLAHLNALGCAVDFHWDSGTVLAKNHSTETHVSGRGGGGTIRDGYGTLSDINIHSEVTNKDELWFRNEHGVDDCWKLTNVDFDVRPGHEISVVSLTQPGSTAMFVTTLFNHSTNRYTDISGRQSWTVYREPFLSQGASWATAFFAVLAFVWFGGSWRAPVFDVINPVVSVFYWVLLLLYSVVTHVGFGSTDPFFPAWESISGMSWLSMSAAYGIAAFATLAWCTWPTERQNAKRYRLYYQRNDALRAHVWNTFKAADATPAQNVATASVAAGDPFAGAFDGVLNAGSGGQAVAKPD